jgi:hypothetical protein
MSLISAYYLSFTAGPIETTMPSGLTIRRRGQELSQRLDSAVACIDQDDDSAASEPPESLGSSEYSKSVNAGISFASTTTTTKERIVLAITTSLSPPPHDLASSPLSSRPYQILTKEYDMDTWRMYERIQTARAQSPVDRITYDSTGDEKAATECPLSCCGQNGAGFSIEREAEEIFELDM